jgi:hypothetical protein
MSVVPRPAWATELKVLTFGGAAGLIVGSLLPWVKAEAGFISVSKNGVDGDGVFTLVLGAAIALVFLLSRRPRRAAVAVTILGGIAAAIAAYDTIDISKKADEITRNATVSINADVGIGLWLALGGSIAVLIGGVLALNRAPRSSV